MSCLDLNRLVCNLPLDLFRSSFGFFYCLSTTFGLMWMVGGFKSGISLPKVFFDLESKNVWHCRLHCIIHACHCFSLLFFVCSFSLTFFSRHIFKNPTILSQQGEKCFSGPKTKYLSIIATSKNKIGRTMAIMMTRWHDNCGRRSRLMTTAGEASLHVVKLLLVLTSIAVGSGGGSGEGGCCKNIYQYSVDAFAVPPITGARSKTIIVQTTMKAPTSLSPSLRRLERPMMRQQRNNEDDTTPEINDEGGSSLASLPPSSSTTSETAPSKNDDDDDDDAVAAVVAKSSTASVAMMISQENRRVLIEELGYKRADVDRLKYDLAPILVEKRIRRPPPTEEDGGIPDDWFRITERELEIERRDIISNDSGSNMQQRLENESKYPLKLPLLGISLILFGKGFGDALITAIKIYIKFPGASSLVTEEFYGVPVLLIDAACVVLGASVGWWTWNTMK